MLSSVETVIPGNVALFEAITAGPASPASLILVAKGFADFGPLLALIVAAVVYFRGDVQSRHAVVVAGIAMLLGLAMNFVIAFLVYVPRPFEMGLGLNLLHHAPETSFPSDHATLIWSLGLALVYLQRRNWIGFIIVTLGAATAWARVYLGAHFPFDMAGSLVISLAAAFAVRLARPWLARTLLPLIEAARGMSLRFLFKHVAS